MVFFMQGMILVPRLVTGKPPTISGQEKDLYIYIYLVVIMYIPYYILHLFSTHVRLGGVVSTPNNSPPTLLNIEVPFEALIGRKHQTHGDLSITSASGVGNPRIC